MTPVDGNLKEIELWWLHCMF